MNIHIAEWLANPAVKSVLALLLGPLAGGLIMGLDRKISARMQGRMGPPLLQPFYDIFKLLGKEPFVLHRPQILYTMLHLVFMMVTVVLLVTGQDLLMILLIHAFSSISLVLGGMSVRSPYSWIGSQRKIMQILAYEPILILLILGIYLRDGSFLGANVLTNKEPLIVSMPLLFLAFVCALAIEFGKSPFDVSSSHHAHQEIIRGVYQEYAGPFFCLTEIAHYYELAIGFGLVMAFWHTSLLCGFLLETAVFFFLLVLDNAFSRLSTKWMVGYMWTVPLSLALANLIWLWR